MVAWLTGWGKRKSHVINAQAGAGDHYQKQITVHYGSGTDGDDDVYCTVGGVAHCKTDFGDIRFTDNDGSSLLDYWMMSKTDSDNAVFWVEIADSLETDPVTIYIYYGKADATTTSNFDTTFIFGDPFDNASLDANRWISVDGTPTYSINATSHYLEITDMVDIGISLGKGFHGKIITFPPSYMIQDAYSDLGFYMWHDTAANNDIFGAIFDVDHHVWASYSAGIAFAYCGDHWGSDKHVVKCMGVGDNTDYNSGEFVPSIPYQFRLKIWKVSGAITITDDGTVRVNAEANSQTPDRIELGIQKLYAGYDFGTKRFYAFLIRKYVSPEPAHSTWGTEENPPVKKVSGSIISFMEDMILG